MVEYGRIPVFSAVALIAVCGMAPDDALAIRTQPRPCLYRFSGEPGSASGGVYLGAGAGMGWSGTNELPIESDNPQGHGGRLDEWGWGLSFEGGYDFWIFGHAAPGLGVFYNYMSTKEAIVDNGWFTGVFINFNVFF